MQELKFNKNKWKKVSLGDIVFEPRETAKNIIDEGFEHIIGLEHIDSDDIHLRKSFSADTDTTFTKIFRDGDVLFGRRRAYLKKAAQATFDGVCSGDITVLRAKENIDSRLLPFIIHNDKFFDYAIKHSAGGLSPRVKFKDLANYEFLLPPREQQAKLADLLWAMDEVIEKDLVVLEKLKNLFLTKEKFYFNNNDDKDRSTKRLEEIADISGGSTPLTTSADFWNGAIPWLTPSDITNYNGIYFKTPKSYITEEGLKSISNKLYPKNSILYCSRASIGEIVINEVPMATNQGFTNLVIKQNINVEYIYFYLKSQTNALKKMASGTTFLEISKQSFRNFKIKIHTKEKQDKISNELNDLFKMELDMEYKHQSSKALQKSLINQIF
ncbi:restriction endonuclease subunit S [uncultured Chryseobacterium sp.]|uniref:restriction endonuclease subunit S n=1 Tax=uncultured Chryseobacterium sp. TaxID=259322 RepID=UPI0025DEB349|nr:restriction endonuclease subunit S [uncultured Chryseobacterium sp.]